jgi:hypothetical protein
MQRVAWTDERLDDFSRGMDTGFERVDRDIRDLRSEMHASFAEMRTLMVRAGGGVIVSVLAAAVLQSI